MDNIKQQSRWLWLLLSLLLALAVLLGAVQAFGVREDPRQAMTRGLCVRTNESWQMDTECRAEYVIPADAGEGLMLSIRTVKKSFALALCGPDGVENWFYEYQQEKGPVELRLFIALPDGAAGKTLRFEAEAPTTLSGMLRNEAVLGTQARITLHYLQSNLYALLFFLFCAFCAAELGLLLLSMRRIFRPEVRYQICIMFGLVLDAGVWILTDSELLTLFTDKASFVAFLSLLSFGLIVPLTLEFIRCTLKEECRGLRLLQQVQMLLLTADILGWLLRGWAMFWLLPLMHLTILASIPLTLRDLFAAYKKTRSEDVRDILVGFGALAVCAAAALVFFYGDHAGWQYAVFYCVGLLCFLLQLGRTVIHRVRQAIDEQAQLENYKNLAYVDSLTGLFNYTAFKYMKSRWPERTDWTYIVMDVNWLKQTNDQYGHRAGDELLCCAARCIREAFYRAEDCFRIGGDEFVIISFAHSMAQSARQMGYMRQELLDHGCELSVGMAESDDGEDIPDLVNQAENEMRKDKKRYYASGSGKRQLRTLNKQLEDILVRNKDMESLLQHLNTRYSIAYVVNLRADTQRPVVVPGYVQKMLDKHGGSFREMLLDYCDKLVAPAYRDGFRMLFDYDYVRDRICREGAIRYAYVRNDGERFLITIFPDTHSVDEVMWVFAKEDTSSEE